MFRFLLHISEIEKVFLFETATLTVGRFVAIENFELNLARAVSNLATTTSGTAASGKLNEKMNK